MDDSIHGNSPDTGQGDNVHLLVYLLGIFLLLNLFPLHAASEGQDRAVPGPVELVLTPEEKAWLAEHPLIVLGGARSLPPFNFIDTDGQYRGYNVDLINIINKNIAAEIRFVPGDWASLQDRVRQKQLAGVVGASVTLERSEFMTFTESYIDVSNALFTRVDYPQVDGIPDFDGRTIALHEGSSSIEIINRHFPGVEIVRTSNHLEALLSVSLGQIDAAYMGLHAGLYEINSHVITNLKVATVNRSGDVDLRIGVRKDWPPLVDILQRALDSVTDEQWQQLAQKWFTPFEESGAMPLKLTEEEKLWLQEHPVIRVVVSANSAPVEFRDSEGNYRGISIEYMKHLEELLGIRLVVAEGVSWERGVAEASQQRLDVISSITRTEKREQSLLFTRAFNSMPVKIFTRNDISYIGSLDNLAGKKVAINNDNPLVEYLSRDYPVLELVSVTPPVEGLQMLSNGEVDAFVENLVSASYYIGEMRLNNVRIAGDTPYSYEQSMAVRDDWPMFAGILQKALDTIDDQQRQVFFNRWMSIRYEVEADYTLFWQGLGIAVVTLLLFVYWNRRLAREVRIREQAEVSLRAMQTELVKQERLSTLGQLTATVSHELRNPLGTILTSTELLSQKLENFGIGQLPALQRLKRATMRCDALINELLDYTSVRAQQLEELSLDSCLDNFVAEYNLPEGITLRRNFHSRTRVLVDEELLRRVLINVVDNACQAMENSAAEKYLDLRTERSGDTCSIVVQDTGEGIPANLLEQVYEPMYSTRTYGVGLGMAIVKQCMQQLGGSIDIDSEPGRGTTVSLYLPVAEKHTKLGKAGLLKS